MKAIYAGSFDPFTTGHLDIAQRALKICDKLIIALGENINKKPFIPLDIRVESIKRLFEGESRISVCSYKGLTIDLAKELKANFLIRGIRNSIDFEYESNMAEINRQLSGIETIMMFADPAKSFISSSMVRELTAYGYDVSQFIPE